MSRERLLGAADKGVEGIAGIGLARPKTVADVLLRELAIGCGQKKIDELFLHGRQVDAGGNATTGEAQGQDEREAMVNINQTYMIIP